MNSSATKSPSTMIRWRGNLSMMDSSAARSEASILIMCKMFLALTSAGRGSAAALKGEPAGGDFPPSDLFQDFLHSLEQIFCDQVGYPRPSVTQILEISPPVTCHHQDRPSAGIDTELDVARTVAHKIGRAEVNLESMGCVFHQSRRGLAAAAVLPVGLQRSEEHTSELQSLAYLVCRLLLEK